MTKHQHAPRYAHHCTCCETGDGCVWLGYSDNYDLWACSTRERGVVLSARYGDERTDCSTFALRMYRGSGYELPEPFYTAYVRIGARL